MHVIELLYSPVSLIAMVPSRAWVRRFSGSAVWCPRFSFTYTPG